MLKNSDDTIFLEPGKLGNGEITLVLASTSVNDPGMNECPCYFFDIQLTDETIVGQIRLRIGDGDDELKYLGHIGYEIFPDHRGNRLAAKSVEALMPFVRENGIETLWINCDSENAPSIRTCELVGAQLKETIEVPPKDAAHRDGIRLMSRFYVPTASEN